MALYKAILQCFGRSTDDAYSPASEKSHPVFAQSQARHPDNIASDILTLLMNAEHKGPELDKTLNEAVGEYGWTQDVAARVWQGLCGVLRDPEKLGKALMDAYNRATEAAVGFATEHPAYTALIALGILVLIMPWALEALGFAEAGPVEGSLAAFWQSRYADYVPKGSLFSFFQRLGMTWKRLTLVSGLTDL